MPAAALSLLVVLAVALTGCPGGGAGQGETCDRHGDCQSTLQCTEQTCVPKCQRAPDCGDGYSCNDEGICLRSVVLAGNRCDSEVDCAAGLSCQISDARLPDRELLAGVCLPQNDGAPPAGATCASPEERRNGTCALGRCVDLCHLTRDCGAGTSCMKIPSGDDLFEGCFPAQGTVTWTIPTRTSDEEIELPVPSGARHASLVITSASLALPVGVRSVRSPTGRTLFSRCPPTSSTGSCTDELAATQYFDNPIRHRSERRTSVLAIPSSPDLLDPEDPNSKQLTTGAYRVRVSSFRPDGSSGMAPLNVTGVLRMGAAATLDLHFHFLDLAEHPCESAFGVMGLAAASAQLEAFFQVDFLGKLRTIFANGGVSLGEITYEDVVGRHDLDGLEVADAGSLLELGTRPTGINVFFVRNLSPVGIQAFGPNPGPAGVGGTQRSGIIVGLDALCYRTWDTLARITAHEIARYMGLHHNIEIGDSLRDPISDSDDSSKNLMFYSERGDGFELSPGQRDILTRSPILR